MLINLFDELHSHTFVVIIFDFIERKEVFFS